MDDEDAPDNYGQLMTPNALPLTNLRAKQLYLGKTYIFSLEPSGKPGVEPHYGTVWPLSARKWVERQLQSGADKDCPQRLPPSGH